MWRIGMVTLALLAWAVPGWSDDIYRWTDGSGAVHFSNTPVGVGGGDPEKVTIEGHASFGQRTESNAEDAPASDARNERAPDADRFSTQASLRRRGLERNLRTANQRLHDIDARLAELAEARTRHSAGLAITGGLGTNAGNYLSDEEKQLTEERKQLAAQTEDMRADGKKLRDEVVSREGEAPSWWRDVR
jgi:hypothetical protein